MTAESIIAKMKNGVKKEKVRQGRGGSRYLWRMAQTLSDSESFDTLQLSAPSHRGTNPRTTAKTHISVSKF
jgi:hypothetical protein